MGDKSAIEWTDATWNPVTGCTKVSQGCKHCYAERLAPKVFAGQQIGDVRTGEQRPRVFTDIVCHPERLDQPLHWKKPRRIFVNSMSDLFHEDVPDEFIGHVFFRMAYLPRHTFQVLTKRPQRMLEWVAGQGLNAIRYGEREEAEEQEKQAPWPLRNVWLGVSVEDPATAAPRIQLLAETPAAVRFVSYEPALGPVNF